MLTCHYFVRLLDKVCLCDSVAWVGTASVSVSVTNQQFSGSPIKMVPFCLQVGPFCPWKNPLSWGTLIDSRSSINKRRTKTMPSAGKTRRKESELVMNNREKHLDSHLSRCQGRRDWIGKTGGVTAYLYTVSRTTLSSRLMKKRGKDLGILRTG